VQPRQTVLEGWGEHVDCVTIQLFFVMQTEEECVSSGGMKVSMLVIVTTK